MLLNLIFPDYPDEQADGGEKAQEVPQNEKEIDKSVSFSAGCAYTHVMVERLVLNTNLTLITNGRNAWVERKIIIP